MSTCLWLLAFTLAAWSITLAAWSNVLAFRLRHGRVQLVIFLVTGSALAALAASLVWILTVAT